MAKVKTKKHKVGLKPAAPAGKGKEKEKPMKVVKRNTILKEIASPNSANVEGGDAQGLAFLAREAREDKAVQTIPESLNVYEENLSEGREEDDHQMLDLVTRQAEALLAAKQLLSAENSNLRTENAHLLNQIDSCERQRLEVIELNSALQFENSVLSGTLSKARDRTGQQSALEEQGETANSLPSPPTSPLPPQTLSRWFDKLEATKEYCYDSFVSRHLFGPSFSLGERVGEIVGDAVRSFGEVEGQGKEYTLASALRRQIPWNPKLWPTS